MEAIDSRSYPIKADDLFDVVLGVTAEAGFGIKKVEKEIRRIQVSTSVSLFSFGESLEIIVAMKENGSIVYVRSKSRVPWNISADVRGKIKTLFGLVDQKV